MADVAEQLLALELAREARRKRRNRVLVWAAVVVAVALVVWLGVVRPAQEQAARDERREQSIYCSMVYDYGSDAYEECLNG